jgi:hypothetical protein
MLGTGVPVCVESIMDPQEKEEWHLLSQQLEETIDHLRDLWGTATRRLCVPPSGNTSVPHCTKTGALDELLRCSALLRIAWLNSASLIAIQADWLGRQGVLSSGQ